MSRTVRALSKVLVIGLTALAAVAPAAAQPKDDEEKLPPFDVRGLTASKQWLPWVIAFLFVGATVGIAFKNPHRSHLD